MTERRYQRRPGIAWREEEEAKQAVLDDLSSGREGGEEGTLILVDAGTVFTLNLLGAEIWKLCDGTRGAALIADALMERFDVERDRLEADVREFLDDMVERGWVVTA